MVEHLGRTNLSEALEQLNEIHGHMARSEVYEGYKPLPIALAGFLGLLAAAVQPMVVASGDPQKFVYYWLGTAGLCAVLAEPFLIIQLMRQSTYERRRTLRVWGQFVPCLAAGGAVGLGICKALPEATALLPGLWAIIFSLGIFSTRPFLPRATGWVALFYLLAGSYMLLHPSPLTAPAWPMAITFLVGQCAGALIIYLNIERRDINGER